MKKTANIWEYMVLMPVLPTLCVCENVELQKTRIGTTLFQINILGNNNTFNTKQNMEHDPQFQEISYLFFTQLFFCSIPKCCYICIQTL